MKSNEKTHEIRESRVLKRKEKFSSIQKTPDLADFICFPNGFHPAFTRISDGFQTARALNVRGMRPRRPLRGASPELAFVAFSKPVTERVDAGATPAGPGERPALLKEARRQQTTFTWCRASVPVRDGEAKSLQRHRAPGPRLAFYRPAFRSIVRGRARRVHVRHAISRTTRGNGCKQARRQQP